MASTERPIVVFVPLVEEMKSIIKRANDDAKWTEVPVFSEDQTEYGFRYSSTAASKRWVYFKVLNDMGNLPISLIVAQTIATYQPVHAFILGIAGSLDPQKCSLGDVVVSSAAKMFFPDKVKQILPRKKEEQFDTDPAIDPAKITLDSRKKVFNESFLRYRRTIANLGSSHARLGQILDALDKDRLNLSPVLVSKFSNLDPALENRAPKVAKGVVFGSDMVIDSEEFVTFIHEKNGDVSKDYYYQKNVHTYHQRSRWLNDGLTIVDMETFGFLKAIERYVLGSDSMRAVAIRGVSDLAYDKNGLEETTNNGIRDIAVQNAISVLMGFIDYIETHTVR